LENSYLENLFLGKFFLNLSFCELSLSGDLLQLMACKLHFEHVGHISSPILCSFLVNTIQYTFQKNVLDLQN
jgi:hypothetical protein